MRKRTKLVVYLLIMCLMVSIMPNNVSAAKRIKLSKKSVTLYIGQTKTIKLKGTTKKPKWSSSKKSVATVSKKGKIKAKKKGSAVIVAKLGKKKYKCKVKVKARPNPSVPPKVDVPQNDNMIATPPVAVPTSNPPAVPTSNPPAASTAAPTVAANYQKLAGYIVENGTYSQDGGYYFIVGPTNEEIYTSCAYNLDGSYTFSIMFTYDDTQNLVTVTITPPDYAKGAVANIFVQSNDTSNLLYADGEVVLSTLTKTNHSITYTDTNAPTKDSRDSLYELGEAALGLGLQNWDEMIVNTGLGLSLKDLGFTSYEGSGATTPVTPTTAPTSNPTVAPTSVPTTAPTAAPIVAANYQKLGEYIVENGTYSEDGEYYYIVGPTDEQIYTSCDYNLDGSYEFSIMYTYNGADDLVTVTITPPDYSKGAVANIFVQSNDASNLLYAKGEVVLSTLTDTNHSITYTSTNASEGELRDNLYELGEAILGIGLQCWNEMIVNTGLGLSLKDFGFTSYDEDVDTTPTVADNYQKLADYLVKNGEYDEDKGYYYINNLTDDFYTVCKYNSDGSYEFGIMYMHGDADDVVSLTITPPDYTKGAVSNIFVQSNNTSSLLYADGVVVLSSLTKTNHSITYTSTNATGAVRDSLYELGESVLGIGLQNWNTMLANSGSGLSLNDLGFTSY